MDVPAYTGHRRIPPAPLHDSHKSPCGNAKNGPEEQDDSHAEPSTQGVVFVVEEQTALVIVDKPPFIIVTGLYPEPLIRLITLVAP